MAISLYDISVASYLQVLGAVTGVLEKGAAHCAATSIDTSEVVDTCLYPDMLPFHFQIVSVAHHSLGSIKGLESGEFRPPTDGPTHDYAGLQKLIADTQAQLQAYDPETVNQWEGRDVVFRLGTHELPFKAEHFVLSFSHPNLYFHATTAYDILRMKGTPIGKRDFLGQMRMLSR